MSYLEIHIWGIGYTSCLLGGDLLCTGLSKHLAEHLGCKIYGFCITKYSSRWFGSHKGHSCQYQELLRRYSFLSSGSLLSISLISSFSFSFIIVVVVVTIIILNNSYLQGFNLFLMILTISRCCVFILKHWSCYFYVKT